MNERKFFIKLLFGISFYFFGLALFAPPPVVGAPNEFAPVMILFSIFFMGSCIATAVYHLSFYVWPEKRELNDYVVPEPVEFLTEPLTAPEGHELAYVEEGQRV